MIDTEQSLKVKTVEVSAGEPLVLPDEFRRALGLEGGGEYTIIQLNGFVLLTPQKFVSLEILENIRRVLNEDGVTLENLLEGLTQAREEIYQERYANRTAQAV